MLHLIKMSRIPSLDRIGVVTAVFCMIHCLSIPFFLIFGFESLLRATDQEWIEWLIIGLSLMIGLISFIGGFKVHRQHTLPVLFLSGFLLIVSGEFIHHTWLSLGLSISGALIISYAHIQNLKWKRVSISP